MYKYNVNLDVAKDLNSSYENYFVSFKSPVLLSDRDIRQQAINLVPDQYISFGWFTRTVEQEGV